MPLNPEEFERELQRQRDQIHPVTPNPPGWSANLPKGSKEVEVTIKGAVKQEPRENKFKFPWSR